METSLTVLYTANLRGDLELLPRLYSFIKQMKAYFSEDAVPLCPDDPAPANPEGRILLVDLGASCAPDVWHCSVTGGRSTLVVLDSMGYDAASVTGFLTPDGRAKLNGMVRMALVDEAHPTRRDWIQLLSAPGQVGSPTLLAAHEIAILLQPTAATTFADHRLSLASVAAGQIGAARICLKKLPYELEETMVFDLPKRTPPDPTIAGIVDLVTGEARHVQKKRA